MSGVRQWGPMALCRGWVCGEAELGLVGLFVSQMGFNRLRFRSLLVFAFFFLPLPALFPVW